MKFMQLIFSFFFVSLILSPIASSQVLVDRVESNWKNYPYHPEGSKIEFPSDEGGHPWIPGLEWWYYVIHAKGQISGDRYSILVTHFNNLFRFFTVTNITQKTHFGSTAIGPLKAKLNHLNLIQSTKYGEDFLRTQENAQGTLIPFEYELGVSGEKMSLQGTLVAKKKPLMVGGDGYVWVGTSGKSWYYSITQMEMEGVLEYQGITEPIRGKAWMDHQWGPFLISPIEANKLFQSYEWFCIQLDNGTELMISNIFDRNYNRPNDGKHGGVEIYYPDGRSLRTEDVQFERTRYWKDPKSGHIMSMGWRLQIDAWKLNLNLQPDFEQQMVKFPLNGDFWEGSIIVNGTQNNQNVSGRAYGELVHRYQHPQLRWLKFPETIQASPDQRGTHLEWIVQNPDAGNPLKFDLLLVQGKVEQLLVSGLTKTQYRLSLSQLPLAFKQAKFRILAYSSDRTLNGSIDSPLIKDLRQP